jgi:uncharacterized protein with von Willebrand factor type A (vWA) domain
LSARGTAPGPEGAAVGILVAFARDLRAAGLPVGTGRILAFCRAVGCLSSPGAAGGLPLDRRRLYWAGRATLVANHAHIGAYDQIFGVWFAADAGERLLRELTGGLGGEPREPDSALPEVPVLLPGGAEDEAGGEADEREQPVLVGQVASDLEALRMRAFEHLDDDERRQAAALVRRLKVDLPVRRARRRRPSPAGASLDLRRTLRRSLRTQGEPLERAWRSRRTRPRPLVLVLDVSGSMTAYSRALVQFGFAAMAARGRVARPRVEVLCFGTRLTRVTRALRSGDPDVAMRKVAQSVVDWDGGTRIGASLKQLLDRHSQQAWLRGAVVVVCSDGLDRGDPRLLGRQVARLRRVAHRVVWVNPLKGDPRYLPLARGMAAAMPHLDVFLPGHNVASLEALGEVLGDRPGRAAPGRPPARGR